MGIPDLKKLVHSPEGFDAFGRSLLKALKRRGFLGFFCFSEFEQEIFVHPAVSPDVAQQALEFLMQSEWRDDPVEAFPQVFRRLGFSLEDSKRVVQSSFLMSGASEKPLGAYAVLEDSTAAASGPAPDYQSVDALLTELVRSRMAIQKYRDAARDTEATADIVRRVGSILHNSTQRQQVLAGILDLAMAVARADVGAMLAVDDGELRPEVELGLALGQIEGLRFYPEDESILDRVSRSGQPLVIDDVSAAAFRAAAALPPQVRGLIAVPLFLESELKGLICLAGGASGRELSAGSLEPLESVSAFMALAFENAVLRANRGGGERGVPRRPADFDAMLLDLLFGVESDGVALGDDLGRVVYLNPAAQKLLGVDPLATRAASKPVEVDGEAPESWLRSQWLECKPGEAMKAAVRTSAGVGIDCTLRRLESRGHSGRRCAGYWARLQSQEKAGDVGLRGASAVAEELRESLSKVKLGVEALAQGVDPAAPAAEAAAWIQGIAGIVQASIEDLVRTCEDLELENLDAAKSRRCICPLGALLKQAIRSVHPEVQSWPPELEAVFADKGILVLVDPLVLQLALVRVLAHLQRAGEKAEDGLPKIRIECAAERVQVRLEVKRAIGAGEISGRSAPLAALEDGALRVSRGGLKAAAYAINQFGGSLSSGRSAGGSIHVELVLPLAPGALRRVRPGNAIALSGKPNP